MTGAASDQIRCSRNSRASEFNAWSSTNTTFQRPPCRVLIFSRLLAAQLYELDGGVYPRAFQTVQKNSRFKYSLSVIAVSTLISGVYAGPLTIFSGADPGASSAP